MTILLIRSAPVHQCRGIIEELSRTDPTLDIAVLTHTTSTGEIVKIHPVRIFNYSSKKLNILLLGTETWRRLRRTRYTKVIIACRNHLGDGYGQIKALALLLGAREVELWSVHHDKIKITWLSFIFTMVVWKVSLVFHSVIWFFLLARDMVFSIINISVGRNRACARRNDASRD